MVSYSRISIFCKFICNHWILISMVFVGSMTRKEYQNPWIEMPTNISASAYL
jgi:hypothetical protein